MSDTLYQELILELNRHPMNKLALADFDVKHKENNPLCGDQVELFIKFGKDDRVSEVGYQGDGCAISQAAVSLLTDHIKGKTKTEMLALTKDDILKLLGLTDLNPARLRCALLGLKALQKGLTVIASAAKQSPKSSAQSASKIHSKTEGIASSLRSSQ